MLMGLFLIMIVSKSFSELSNLELYEILTLRSEIFVVEQNCIYLDLDGKDLESQHVYLKNNNEIAAYARIVPPSIAFDEVSIGRIIVKKNHRKIGYAEKVIQYCIDSVKSEAPSAIIRIGAQHHLIEYYSKFGFKVDSEPYDEDGILHIEMILT